MRRWSRKQRLWNRTHSGNQDEQERRCNKQKDVGTLCILAREVVHLQIHIVHEHDKEYTCSWGSWKRIVRTGAENRSRGRVFTVSQGFKDNPQKLCSTKTCHDGEKSWMEGERRAEGLILFIWSLDRYMCGGCTLPSHQQNLHQQNLRSVRNGAWWCAGVPASLAL